MANEQHTPGPWSFSGSDNLIMARSKRYGQSTGRVIIAEIKRHRLGTADRVCPDEIQDANMRLIQAAPELFEALRRIQNTYVADAQRIAREAIAKVSE